MKQNVQQEIQKTHRDIRAIVVGAYILRHHILKPLPLAWTSRCTFSLLIATGSSLLQICDRKDTKELSISSDACIVL